MGDHPLRSPTSNYYSILGLPKNASLTDICKAYKALVMKWHPDKNPSNQAEAEAKIRSINEAYRVLATKKREEDIINIDDPKTPENSFLHRKDFASGPWLSSGSPSWRSHTPIPSPRNLSKSASRRSMTPTPTDFYPSLSRSSSRRTMATTPTTPKEPASLSRIASRQSTTPINFLQSMARRKPQPIERKLECTLEELCHGCVKKIKITRDVISHTGLIVQEEEILKIKVKPGWKNGTKITFEGRGDQKPGTEPADIIFLIDEKRHPMYKREGDDLALGVEIPLVQALAGCTITVPLLGGEKMILELDDILYPGYKKIIPGQGMPISKGGSRGDLVLKFLVEFPTELSNEQRSTIVSILQESS